MDEIDISVVAYVLAIYAAAVLSPGPNFAVVSRLAVQGRRAAASRVIAGLAVTATFYAVLAMAGLAVVLNQIAWLARGVQIAGGLYLIYLGISAWLAARHPPEDLVANVLPEQTRQDVRTGLRLGCVVCLANPKSIIFFTSLYAAAIPFDAALATKGIILFGGFSLELVWYSFVLFIFSTSRIRAVYRRYVAWIERGIGTVLAYFGLRLILEKA